jgi:hypothetical protein
MHELWLWSNHRHLNKCVASHSMGLQHFLVLLNTFLKENARFFPNMANCHHDKTWIILTEKKTHNTPGHCTFRHTSVWTYNAFDVYLLNMQTKRGVNCELEIATTRWNCYHTFSCQKTTTRIFTPSHNKTRLSPVVTYNTHWKITEFSVSFISISVHIS